MFLTVGVQRFLIITNNPMVNDIKDAEVLFIEGSWQQVFYQVYHQAAVGHRLLSHPLAGSFKAGVSPYRSIVLSNSKNIASSTDLAVLDKCMAMVEDSKEEIAKAVIMDAFARDYQRYDQYLLEGTLQSLCESRVL